MFPHVMEDSFYQIRPDIKPRQSMDSEENELRKTAVWWFYVVICDIPGESK